MEYSLTITNLTCGACIKVCTMILKKMDGVQSVEIQENGATKIVSNKPLDMERVLGDLKGKGYAAVTA